MRFARSLLLDILYYINYFYACHIVFEPAILLESAKLCVLLPYHISFLKQGNDQKMRIVTLGKNKNKNT